jgi:hypothetical protein
VYGSEESFMTMNAKTDLCLIYKQSPQKGITRIHFQSDTENKCDNLELHTCNSRYRNSQSFVSN